MSNVTPDAAHESQALAHAEDFFAFIFGDTLPVRRFESTPREMEFLRNGALYGTVAVCDLCGTNHAPHIVTSEQTDEDRTLIWKATCIECFGQVRLPTRETDDGDWEFAADPEYVALDPVPTYEQRAVEVHEEADETHDAE